MVRARTAEIDLTAALAEKISTTFHVEEVLEHVYESMDSIIPYDRIGYAEVDPESNVARAVWARSNVGEIRLETLYEAAVAETSLGEVLESGKPRVLDDLQAYLREHPNSESTQLIVEEGMHPGHRHPKELLTNAKQAVERNIAKIMGLRDDL